MRGAALELIRVLLLPEVFKQRPAELGRFFFFEVTGQDRDFCLGREIFRDYKKQKVECKQWRISFSKKSWIDLTFFRLVLPYEMRGTTIRMNQAIDVAIVQRAIAGEEEAIRQTLLKVQDLAWVIGRDFCHDWDDAQDLTQEILIEIARSLPELRDPEHFVAWCFTLGKRVCIHWNQRQLRRRHIWDEFHRSEESVDPSIAASPFVDPQVAVLEEDRRGLIIRSLKRLGTHTRETMRLFYLEEWSLSDVARHLKVSENTVKQRLYAGRRRLKEELEHMPATAEERQHATVDPLLSFSHTGSWTGNSEHIHALLRPLLVQQILLQIAKVPKSIAQIASAIGVDRIYVEDHLSTLIATELVRMTDDECYFADFIILDRDIQHGLDERSSRLGRAAAEIIATRLPKLRVVFDTCGIKEQGFGWDYMRWLVLPAWVATAGIHRAAPEIYRIDLPLRPDGNRWFFSGRPAGITRSKWQIWCSIITDNAECSFGSFGTPALGFETSPIPDGCGEKRAILRALVACPKVIDELAPEEEARTELAELIEGGYCRKSGDQVYLNLPLITPTVDRALYPVVQDVCRDIATQVYKPGMEGVDDLLDQSGYGRLQNQYSVVMLSYVSSLNDYCFAELVEMGLLGELPTQRHTAWGCWMWKGNIELGRW